ncbi:hypothetical protein OHS16_01490 [Streptomyces sp. NBC_00344]
MYEALHAVVQGGPFSDDKAHAFQYGYAYERLCSLPGSLLDNSCFTPRRGDWLSVVDQGLRALNITAVSVAAFGNSDLPAPLPWTYAPGCGEWTPAQIGQALEQFVATMAAGHAPPLDPEVVEAVMQCLGWMRRAEAQPGFGITGFPFLSPPARRFCPRPGPQAGETRRLGHTATADGGEHIMCRRHP